MSDYDEDETQQQVVIVGNYQPNWRFSGWDVIAGTLHILGSALHGAGQGIHHIGMSASAHANWKRQNWELEAARAHEEAIKIEMEARMAEIVGLPEVKK